MEITNYDELLSFAQNCKGQIDTIYLHWSAGYYDTQFSDYHININGDGDIYIDGNFTDHKNHTWHRNSNAIGIAVDAMVGADIDDFGECPVTKKQIEVMARIVAVLCKGLDLEINEDNVMTHAEAARLDGYGIDDSDPDLRWDLLKLSVNEPDWSGGEILRGKANWYREHYYE